MGWGDHMTEQIETPLELLERRLADASALEDAARVDWAASFRDAPEETARLYDELKWAQGYLTALRLVVDDVRDLEAAARLAPGRPAGSLTDAEQASVRALWAHTDTRPVDALAMLTGDELAKAMPLCAETSHAGTRENRS